MFWKYAILWLGLAVLGILNGIMRNSLYLNKLGELKAHQVSTVILVFLIGAYTWVASLFWRPESAMQAFLLGVLWFAMTVLFEFIFGHYVIGHPWSRLLSDYNILKGRIWSLVLLWALIAPLVMHIVRS